jgi:GNAT superfamily N-acetyltransferase
MIDEWFEVIELAIPFERFLTLPRNPAYKYEYYDGRAVLSPRPKVYQAVLDVRPGPVVEPLEACGPVRVRPLAEGDWEPLPGLFAHAFHQVPPFVALDDDRRLAAARQCLAKTRGGGDGPLVAAASFVAVDAGGEPLGAALVTMEGRFLEEEIRALAPGGTLPHLTWIFVAPRLARHGIGSALLERTLLAARNRGVKLLHMTCLANNRRMQQLARKFDADLTFDFGSVVGEVEAPFPTPMSIWREAMADSHGFATAVLDAQTRLLRRGQAASG